MTDAAERLLQEVLRLPADDRRWLSERLVEQLDADEDFELAPSWRAEIERRVGDIRSGRVRPSPIDEALARIRKSIPDGR